MRFCCPPRCTLISCAIATRRCRAYLDGAPVRFDIFFTRRTQTNGGAMFDLKVTFADKESLHRVRRQFSLFVFDVRGGLFHRLH